MIVHLLNNHLASQSRAVPISNINGRDDVFRLARVPAAALDRFEPAIIQCLVDRDTLAWIWVKHAEDQAPQRRIGKE